MSLGEILEDQNPWWRDRSTRRAAGYPVRRSLQPEILGKIQRRDERRAILIHGPRQVGKTVLLLQTADDLLDAGLPPANLTYCDLSDDRFTSAVSLREVAEIRPPDTAEELPRVLLLDEIGQVDGWDRWLKVAVDQGGRRIVATDSAATILREGGRESGLGRWDELQLEGLTFREFVRLHGSPEESMERVLQRSPNLFERYLALGGFPEHVFSEDFPETRRRLRGDIADRAIVRDLARLGVDVSRVKDLFVYLVQDSGAELNAEARARDLAADARSVREWVRLLTETLLLAPLDRFSRQPSASLRSRQKIFAADSGLVGAFSVLAARDERVRARLFEAATFRHLRELAGGLSGELSYFRQEDWEVDFVLSLPGRLLGIEVTSSPRLKPQKLERLARAGGMLGADRLIALYGGVLEETRDAIRLLPLARFLIDPETLLAEDVR